MEADDFESLTLEQKILCGYYTAKPYNKGAYPIDQLNMPKLSKAWDRLFKNKHDCLIYD